MDIENIGPIIKDAKVQICGIAACNWKCWIRHENYLIVVHLYRFAKEMRIRLTGLPMVASTSIVDLTISRRDRLTSEIFQPSAKLVSNMQRPPVKNLLRSYRENDRYRMASLLFFLITTRAPTAAAAIPPAIGSIPEIMSIGPDAFIRNVKVSVSPLYA